MPDSAPGRGAAPPAAAATRGTLAGELERLYRRARERLERQLGILEREREAVRGADPGVLRELAGLESAGTAEIASLERVIAAFERAAASDGRAGAHPGLAHGGLEHARIRALVIESNLRTRELLRREMGSTARLLVARRARAGTPSPFASIGEATLLDLRR